MTERSLLQKRCSELRRVGLLPATFACTAPTQELRAMINQATLRCPVKVPLPNDILSIIATYTTIKNTFNVIGLSREGLRIAYNNYLWKQKLQYETRGLVVDAVVIEANRGDSSNRWWRYYLAKNRTLYGSTMYTWTGKEFTDPVSVTLSQPVLGAELMHKGHSRGTKTNAFLVFQLADLSIAVKLGPRKRATQIIPFSERISDFYQFNNGDELIITTESGRVFKLSGNADTVALHSLAIPKSAVFGVARIDRTRALSLAGKLGEEKYIALLRRDHSIELYDEATSELKETITDWPAIEIFTDYIFHLLLVDGTEISKNINLNTSIPPIPFQPMQSPHEPTYSIGSERYSTSISGTESIKEEASSDPIDVVVRTHGTGLGSGIYFLGSRTVEFIITPANEEWAHDIARVTGTEGKAQYIAGYEDHGLIVVD